MVDNLGMVVFGVIILFVAGYILSCFLYMIANFLFMIFTTIFVIIGAFIGFIIDVIIWIPRMVYRLIRKKKNESERRRT